jgi:hypothetical protein
MQPFRKNVKLLYFAYHHFVQNAQKSTSMTVLANRIRAYFTNLLQICQPACETPPVARS